MGRMKELFIAMVNEDWEHLSDKEKAFIQAERLHMEQQLMQQLAFEEQQAAKIQVIKTETTEKANEEAADKANSNTLPF